MYFLLYIENMSTSWQSCDGLPLSPPHSDTSLAVDLLNGVFCSATVPTFPSDFFGIMHVQV